MLREEKELRKRIKAYLKNYRKNISQKLYAPSADGLDYLLLMHPDDYDDLVQKSTEEEMKYIMNCFKTYGKLEWLFLGVSNHIWFERCCKWSPEMLDYIPDNKLKEILDSVFYNSVFYTGINTLFNFQTKKRQFRIITLLKTSYLGDWIFHLEGIGYLLEFLEWLFDREADDSCQAEAVVVFKKIADIDNLALAKLLENASARVTQRILQELNPRSRYQEILKYVKIEKLYELVEKSDSFFSECAELYEEVYNRIPETDKIKYFSLLLEKNRDDVFNKVPVDMIVDFYTHLDNKTTIARKIMFSDAFYDFCDFLSEGQKLEFFHLFMENDEDKEQLKGFLQSVEEPDFVEELFLTYLVK